ncbi:zinc finger TRAF-type-containing protein 1 homolog isoform X3 [Danaus plexippus]|uniref:zinc finger TRAF-type-containing protein 1 homolog isoform X3 n=1 Tax=Danaus plexippus TaxID=13037 RepID=UPI0013C45DAA|nr:zinc finger TRAF-type-containing protein 1 homolog isoform X3 [Danaus plexippus]
MAEVPNTEPLPSSSENSVIASDCKDDEEPSPKKRKTALDSDQIEKLEHRLGGILCCAVCLDLPQAAVYQCSNGHLMCAPCFTHLLADARLRDETATCPNCRVDISKNSVTRNLAVEKAVSELPSECRHCTKVFPRHSLQYHEEKICEDRMTSCRYCVLGCSYRGAARAAAAHEAICAHPRRPAAELMSMLARRQKEHEHSLAHYRDLMDLLSYEKITFNDLQLRPFRTEELHKLYFETSRFTAFGFQWVVKAFVNKHQRDPTQSTQREITYQLVMKSKPFGPMCVRWVWTRGPGGSAPLLPEAAQHTFTDEEASPAKTLPLADPDDANRLLASKAVHFRLIMFSSPK